MNCRFCHKEINHVFADLGHAPPSNSYLDKNELNLPETYYPLKLFLCQHCYLVQIDEHKKAFEIFNDQYAYFSSFSTSWLEHCKNYCQKMKEQFHLNEKSLVIEIASNDGYLLQYFKELNIPVLGIEPTRGTAMVALEKGIDTRIEFFGNNYAKSLINEGKKADLVLGNNVLAHVPDLNDFVSGLKTILNTEGIITMEFPHLLQLILNNQFDTIYHEHFSYFSFHTVSRVFLHHGLEIFDVEELTTHGGSLRIYAKHTEDKSKTASAHIQQLISKEVANKLNSAEGYLNFQHKVNTIKNDLLEFLLLQNNLQKRVIAYGAAAKGNTLLNYCGIRNDLLSFVVDKSPAKQGKFLPGSHIPIVSEEEIINYKPDYVLILPWNIKDEITKQLAYITPWGGKFVVAVPKLMCYE
jgi:2-polyprenyl-3-methyl-5-hydroxy-6-metoxy-1,4-benzoquinol methylase